MRSHSGYGNFIAWLVTHMLLCVIRLVSELRLYIVGCMELINVSKMTSVIPQFNRLAGHEQHEIQNILQQSTLLNVSPTSINGNV